MRRSVLFGSNTVIFTIIVAAIVVVVNLVSLKHNKRVDMTSEGMFSIAPQTKKTLDSLKEDIIIIYAFVNIEKRKPAEDLLEQYDYGSDRLSVEVIDPDKKPTLARKYKIEEYGTYVVEAASGRREVVEELSEEKLTNAIIKVTTAKEKKIYVLTGHGERSLDDSNPLGWSGAKQSLESAGYRVETLDWFTTGKIPEDADLVIAAGPKKDFQEAEIRQIRNRLNSGGATMILLDPGKLDNLEKFLGEYGFVFKDDMILDPLSQQLGFDPLVAAVTGYESHPIVERFRSATFFPVARSMELRDGDGRKIEAIARTDTRSWGETDISSIEKGQPAYDEGTDAPGPLTVAAVAEWEAGPPKEERKIGEKTPMTRLVVAGDSDFASNSTLGFSGNKDLFMNMAGWLLEDENRVSIRPKTRGFNPIMFTSAQLKTIFWTVVVGIPALLLVSGIAVRYVRRRT